MLHVFSDFDETLVPVNIAKKLVQYYILHGPDSFFERVRRGLLLLIPKMRRKYFSVYYECLRKIPLEERQRIIRSVPVNENWLREINAVLQKHRKKSAGITIISRNSVDIVNEWLRYNKKALLKYNIEFEGIIANNPIDAPGLEIVREGKNLKHIDYIAFGQMQEEEKELFLNKNSIYIGDSEDELLRPFVKEFISL